MATQGAGGLARHVLVWGGVAATLAGFVQPWAKLDFTEPALAKQLRQTAPGQALLGRVSRELGRVAVEIRRGTEVVTGELPRLEDLPREVSGIQIPRMVNQDNAHVAIALIELLTNTRNDLGRRSYAVYLLPGLAILFGALLTTAGGSRLVAIGVGLACAAIAAGGAWKLATTNLRQLFIAITIGHGLWLSLGGYALLALGALAGLAAPKR